jgi:YesN/AraC family two-component response regulator
MQVSNPSITGANPNIKIFIVDDHPILTEGLKWIISDTPEYEFCGSAESATEALIKIKQTSPAIV